MQAPAVVLYQKPDRKWSSTIKARVALPEDLSSVLARGQPGRQGTILESLSTPTPYRLNHQDNLPVQVLGILSTYQRALAIHQYHRCHHQRNEIFKPIPPKREYPQEDQSAQRGIIHQGEGHHLKGHRVQALYLRWLTRHSGRSSQSSDILSIGKAVLYRHRIRTVSRRGTRVAQAGRLQALPVLPLVLYQTFPFHHPLFPLSSLGECPILGHPRLRAKVELPSIPRTPLSRLYQRSNLSPTTRMLQVM